MGLPQTYCLVCGKLKEDHDQPEWQDCGEAFKRARPLLTGEVFVAREDNRRYEGGGECTSACCDGIVCRCADCPVCDPSSSDFFGGEP